MLLDFKCSAVSPAKCSAHSNMGDQDCSPPCPTHPWLEASGGGPTTVWPLIRGHHPLTPQLLPWSPGHGARPTAGSGRVPTLTQRPLGPGSMFPATLPVPHYCKLLLAIVSFRGASWSHHLPRGLDWVWALMAATVLTACPPGPWLVAALTVHTNPSADTNPPPGGSVLPAPQPTGS